ncbi:hypothetical protein HDV03_004062 [Kappamyces sp. JEL0829]|nr:hypothetical protein HDV03_004062 [Kappamyces sp. JEL0829]
MTQTNPEPSNSTQLLIGQIHQMENELVAILGQVRRAVQLLDSPQDMRVSLEAHGKEMMDAISKVNVGISSIIDQLDPSILAKRSNSFPYILSPVADQKTLEIQMKGMELVADAIDTLQH